MAGSILHVERCAEETVSPERYRGCTGSGSGARSMMKIANITERLLVARYSASRLLRESIEFVRSCKTPEIMLRLKDISCTHVLMGIKQFSVAHSCPHDDDIYRRSFGKSPTQVESRQRSEDWTTSVGGVSGEYIKRNPF